MELIRNLCTRKNKTGGSISSTGLFLCPYCKKKVIKDLGAGKRAKSCNCMNGLFNSIAHFKHGDKKFNSKYHYLYVTWLSMRRRCYYVTNVAYKRYGGRGIIVCDEWLHDYPAFKKWAIVNGCKYGLQIDRENNDGNYEPNNCRFVTSIINNQNMSTTKMTSGKVVKLRKLFATGFYTQVKLAQLFLISKAQANRIISRQRWANIN